MALAASSDAVVLICALNGAPKSKLVKAYQKGGFDAGVFTVSTRPVTVYVAQYEKTAPPVAIGWDGEDTVLINEKAYCVTEIYTEVE